MSSAPKRSLPVGVPLRRSGTEDVWSMFAARRADPASGGLVDLCRDADPIGWPAIADAAERAGAKLFDVGVGRGDRVALLARNSAELAVVLGGAARCGAIVVPIDVALKAEEVAYRLEDSSPVAIVIDDEFDAVVGEAIARARGPRVLRAREFAPEVLDAAGFAAPSPERVGPSGPMDPYMILYTSGTTDRPKGVVHTHRAMVEEASRTVQAWSIRPDDVILGHMPMYHVSGLTSVFFPGLSVGATVAITAVFSASRWSSEVRQVQATVVPLVGPLVRMIMAQAASPDDADNAIRLVTYGLAVPLEMEHEFQRRFRTGPMYAMSGSTECIGVAYCEPAYSEHRWPALGRPAADREVMLVDEAGNPVPPGAEGELCVRGERGAALMLEYWNRPDATAAAVVDGWFHTGDIGRMDDDGFIYFVDRIKDIIKRSGENVSASEVERVIGEIDGVVEAAVVSKPDPVRDEAIVAYISVSSPSVTADVVIEHCAARLAKYKVPSEVLILDELPHTSLGKIEKKVLRAAVRAAS